MAAQKITLSSSRDIPFNKLVLSQANVRRTKAGVSIEQLADDIAHRGLLQNLNVRPVLDGEGQATGMFEVPAGGRRYRALELLVTRKHLPKTAPVPCNLREAGSAISPEEDSLAENTQREPLHPLDQFRAFQALVDGGMVEEEVAARFFVTPAVVKQRLRLAAVSPKLLDLYAEDAMTLDQLMAFTVTGDHARQEQVWEAVNRGYNREAYLIRRMLTEGAVRASDKRAQFVGVEAYEQAGGVVLRDLFHQDDGGWLQDPALLDQLVADKLRLEAEAIVAEGWRWIEVAAEFPYGHMTGLRRLRALGPVLTDEEQATYDALQTEYGALEESYADSPDDLPEAVDQRLAEIEAALDGFHNRPPSFEPAEVARAGAFVSIDASGRLKVERGYVRPADEAPVEPATTTATGAASGGDQAGGDHATPMVQRAVITVGGAPAVESAEEDEGVKPIPERLMTELTAHRTLALRDALAHDFDVAFRAMLHALVLRLFFRLASDCSCLEVEPKSEALGIKAPGLADTASAAAIAARHQAWADQLPRDPGALWDALALFDADSRQALFAHCVGLTLNAVHEPFNRRPRALDHAGRLAQGLGLDMTASGWTATVGSYLGRVTKGRILEAVREARGEQAAQLIDHLRKPDMAREAERLLDGTGWLPEPLRTPGNPAEVAGQHVGAADEVEALPAFLTDAGDAANDAGLSPEPHLAAAK